MEWPASIRRTRRANASQHTPGSTCSQSPGATAPAQASPGQATRSRQLERRGLRAQRGLVGQGIRPLQRWPGSREGRAFQSEQSASSSGRDVRDWRCMTSPRRPPRQVHAAYRAGAPKREAWTLAPDCFEHPASLSDRRVMAGRSAAPCSAPAGLTSVAAGNRGLSHHFHFASYLHGLGDLAWVRRGCD